MERATQCLESPSYNEHIQNELGFTCVFTVAQNAFVGLEFTETTCFDLIFLSNDLKHLNALDFLHILRNVGAPTDIVLIVEQNDPCTEIQAKNVGFYDLLRKEFQLSTLCSKISHAVNRHRNLKLINASHK